MGNVFILWSRNLYKKDKEEDWIYVEKDCYYSLITGLEKIYKEYLQITRDPQKRRDVWILCRRYDRAKSLCLAFSTRNSLYLYWVNDFLSFLETR